MKLVIFTMVMLSFTSSSAFADEECVIKVDEKCMTAVQLESGLSRLKALYELRAASAENSPNGLGKQFIHECTDAASNYNTYITKEISDKYPNWEISVDPNRCYASKNNDSGLILFAQATENLQHK